MKKRKIKKGNMLLLFMLLVFSSLFVISLIKIINYLKDTGENKKIEQVVEESIKIDESKSEDKKYIVDFDTLKSKNLDTIAYLKVKGTNISNIIVKGNDNSYYLNHNFEKKKNVSGWLFMDYHNKLDGTDKNIVIYGHNMHNGSMFGTLKNTLKSDYQKNSKNNEIIFVTEEGTHIFRVFSTYTIEPEDNYINTIFTNNEEYKNFLDEISKRSNYDYGVKVDVNDTILTLSTCTSNGKKRVVLHAKEVKTVNKN